MGDVSHPAPPGPVVHPIILYDGVCGLCNRMNQFVLRRDPEDIFRFASLQSALGARILARHGADPRDLDTVYVVVNHECPDEHLLPRSDAVIFILKHLGGAELRSAGQPGAAVSTQASIPSRPGRGIWRLVGVVLELIPRALRDWGYRVVASNRYRLFGRFETCMVPGAENRNRFLDV
jgi:predicted DCC family thiol-disulfide oxidoreductase YuxK